jgi:hypothetical protein
MDIQLVNTSDLLSEMSAYVTILPEEQILPDEKLGDEAIGLFVYRPDAIGAWFGVERELYTELWKQVASDNYVDCIITLTLKLPFQQRGWIWDVEASKSLLIDSASIAFVRSREKKQEPPAQKRGFFR